MIVQKFGGVAMQNKEMRNYSMHHIQQALQKYKKVVIIVSAIGRYGNPYATDSLITLSEALAYDAASKDLIASCGELIAAAVLSAELHQFGIQNKVLHGKQAGIITTGEFNAAEIAATETTYILQTMKEIDCIIIPGFQGMNQQGDVMTLGRGGSDLTAVALADALQAKHVEFFKDVPGVLTGDPAIVSTYEKFDFLTFDQFLQLLHDENGIVQKKAALWAKEKEIPLYIRGITHEEAGTWISTS